MSAAVEILVLIDELDDLVHNARPVPLIDQVRIDQDKVYWILERIRELLPEALIQARDAGDEDPPVSGEEVASPVTPIDLEPAAQSLRQLVERVKFGGEAFLLESHGMGMAELRPVRE